jgi:hypothetical protein
VVVVYEARTREQLHALLADLPGDAEPPARPTRVIDSRLLIVLLCVSPPAALIYWLVCQRAARRRGSWPQAVEGAHVRQVHRRGHRSVRAQQRVGEVEQFVPARPGSRISPPGSVTLSRTLPPEHDQAAHSPLRPSSWSRVSLAGAHDQTKSASTSGERPGERPSSRSNSTHR